MGEKDDYDSENSWIAEGLPSSSHRLFSLSVGKGHELGEGVANGLLRVSALYVKKIKPQHSGAIAAHTCEAARRARDFHAAGQT